VSDKPKDLFESGDDAGSLFDTGDDVPQAISAPASTTPGSEPLPPEAPPAARLYGRLRALGQAGLKMTVPQPAGDYAASLIPEEATARGAVASALQGPAVIWADEAAGLLQERDAALKFMVDGGQRPNMEQAYRDGREAFRNTEGAFRNENPAAAFALTALSGAALGGPLTSTSKGLARYLPSLAEGAIAGAGAADEARDIPEAAAVGAPLGVAGHALGEVAGDLIGAGVNAVANSRPVQALARGLLTPSAAAQYLRSKHVGNLTVGQMAPESFLAQMEEAGTSSAGIGPAIKAQRDAGARSFQQAVLREATPPGMTEPIGDTLGEQVESIFGGFKPAYDVARGHPIPPNAVQAALSSIDDPSIYASDATRQQVADFIRDQMTAMRMRADGSVDSGDVMNLRSFLRQEVRNLPDDARQDRALFSAAIDSLTNALDSNLPPDAATALRAADQQYAKAKIVADAVGRGKDQVDGFTTKQFTNAVASNTPTRTYQQGGGGELRRLAQAGEKTIGAKIPITGARLLAAGPVPYVTGPMSYAANLPGPKAFLLGQTGVQQSLARALPNAGQGAADALGRAGAAAVFAQRNAVEARDRRDTSTSDVVQDLVTNEPEALGPYAQQLQQAAADGNLPIVHYALQQTDPQYRQILEQLRTGGTQ